MKIQNYYNDMKIENFLKRLGYRQNPKSLKWYKPVGFTLITMKIIDDKLECSQWFVGVDKTLCRWTKESINIDEINSFYDILCLEAMVGRNLYIFRQSEENMDSLIPVLPLHEFFNL